MLLSCKFSVFLALCFLFCFVVGKEVVLEGTLRDFKRSHPDFEFRVASEKNLVRNVLGPDRKPVFNTARNPPSRTINNENTFNQWYRDVPGINARFPHKITLKPKIVNGREDPRIVFFEDSSFFPLDGRGISEPMYGHNFHFTMELHGRFGYQGGEVFTFSGDDDVWVFINDRLVIDLGGVHAKETATVNLDAVASSIGIQRGRNYKFDFFFAERHTTQSNFRIETSIEIFCSYYDRCGVCEGDGTSCPCNCDDQNVCTIDSCDVRSGQCIHDQISCDDNNVCTIDTCNPQTGCPASPRPQISCDDGDLCTDDFCNPRSGCINSPKICDDSLACTVDFCNKTNGQCVFDDSNCESCLQPTEIVCTSNDVCAPAFCDGTLPRSDPNKCQTKPIICDDGNACTIDECQPDNSNQPECVFTPINCTSDDPCKVPYCNSSVGCLYEDLVCDDGDPCTRDTCVSGEGCKYEPYNPCEDGLFCTENICESGVGCIAVNRTCVVGNADCEVGQCEEDARECNSIERPGRNEVQCDDAVKAAVIGSAALAGIVIASIAGFLIFTAVAGKVGYDYYKKHKIPVGGVNENPLYEHNLEAEGQNPLYSDESILKTE